MKSYDLPKNLIDEVKEFEYKIKEFQAGAINPVQFKGIRVPHGIYEQREPMTHMMRIRCAGGIALPRQLKKTAELAEKYGSGIVHITTRQEMQIHNVKIQDIVTIYRELISVGLSSRGGGGNTIRNIVASHDSGVNPKEAFDIGPHTVALTSKMIAKENSFNLPRKFKISFSNGGEIDSRAMITDLGFLAKIKDGQKGFKVFCAGGMGASSALGVVLFDFIEEDKVYCVTEALKLMFNAYGNRRQKHKSRIRFLYKSLGEEKFKQYFNEEYQKLLQNGYPVLELEEIENKDNKNNSLKEEDISAPEFELWKNRYVKEQKQEGLFSVELPLFLGDITAKDAVKLAEFLENFGENSLRFSIDQNMHLRNIPEAYLGNVFRLLPEIKTISDKPSLTGKMIACTGADTCKLGLCLPRGVTPEIQRALFESGLDLDKLDVRIHVSGCANSCGCHHSADLGFKGKIMRKDKELLPAYVVLAGAVISENESRFAEELTEVASKDMPSFVVDVLKIYSEKKARFNSFYEYAQNEGREDIIEAAKKYSNIPSYEEDASYYTDWTAKEKFTVLKGQKAECSASLYDMIDFDKEIIDNSLEKLESVEGQEERNNLLKKILFSASRMLLVTKGLEASDELSVYGLFLKNFIGPNLVSGEFADMIKKAQNAEIGDYKAFEDKIIKLADSVKKLYESMDDSLQFKTEESPEEPSSDENSAEKFKDLRGVKCPMNFVKAKIELTPMKSGDKLALLLDDGEPIENVPGSIESEGHAILKKEKQAEHWFLLVKKG
ncbi:MAG: sulfurtransferase TusA family protein [Spirochaetia bacterium]|nr:sulfurtransferase TusA family protein [Spirochaetia bacterium]